VPAERTARKPWWLKVQPHLGRAPALTRHQWQLLGMVGAANLFDNYGVALMALALPQIQSGLGVSEAEVGGVIGLVRLGVIPAILFTVLADYIGRRLLLLWTIVGLTSCTFLTGFARDPQQFTVLQFLARMFIAGEAMLAVVVIAEEFDAETRGWGIGILAALGTLGHGLAAIIFAVVNVLPFGWRMLYVLGAAPLVLLTWFRRSLGETQRFETHQRARLTSGVQTALEPFRNLVRMYPGRMVALCAALFPFVFVMETAMIFMPKSLQQVHGYSPAGVALLNLTMVALAPIGNVVGGSLADRFGRKRVLAASILLNAAAIGLFYNTGGRWIPPIFGVMLLTLTMSLVLFAALGSELFPTSYRSTASGVRAVVATLGAALGFWVEGRLYSRFGSHAGAITAMLVVTPIAPLIIALFLPETAKQELEDIAPELA